MEPRVSLLTLGVSDLERAVAFYRDGLGWHISEVGGGEVAFRIHIPRTPVNSGAASSCPWVRAGAYRLRNRSSATTALLLRANAPRL